MIISPPPPPPSKTTTSTTTTNPKLYRLYVITCQTLRDHMSLTACMEQTPPPNCRLIMFLFFIFQHLLATKKDVSAVFRAARQTEPSVVLGCPECVRTNGVPFFAGNWTGAPPCTTDGHDHHVAATHRYMDHLVAVHSIGAANLCRGHLPVEVINPGAGELFWVPVLREMAARIDVSD